VPAGTTLTTYTGPCTITTANVVIDAKTINCSPLVIQAKAVMIKNSRIDGQVYINSDDPRTQYNMNFSVTVQDSEVSYSGTDGPVIFEGAMTLIRDDIHGGVTGVQCGDKAAQCVIQDSWLHGMINTPNIDTHLGGFHSIGGSNYTLTHNTVYCDAPVNNVGGGCSGDIVFIPYNVAVTNGTVANNLLGASTSLSYCLYAGDDPTYNFSNMTFKNNVFQRGSNGKCGDYGPVAGYNALGTVSWAGNIWTDGLLTMPAY